MNPTAQNGQSPFANATPPGQISNAPPAPVISEPQIQEILADKPKDNKKIIAGLLGILILTVGVTAGVILLKQNQDPQREAASCSDWCTSPQDCSAAGGTPTVPCSFSFCDPPSFVACSLDPDGGDGGGGGDQCSVTFPGGVTGSIVISSSCEPVPFENYYRRAEPGTTDNDCVGTNDNFLGIKNLGPGTHNPRDYGPGGCGWCVQLDNSSIGGSAQYTGDCPTPTPTKPPSSSPSPTATPTPTPTVTPAPTATPTMPPGTDITAMCLDIRAYDSEWTSLTANDLTELQPGDVVRFSVRGNASDNGINKARFSLNGAMPIETTQTKPGTTNEYYQEFSLPQISEGQNSLTINVKAELYHPVLNMWF